MNKIIVDLLQERIEECSIKAKSLYEAYQYYCGDKTVRRQLISVFKKRSEYKRTLKEYKKLCHDIEVEKYRKVIKEYGENPDKLIENMLGIKLYKYQKIMLKVFYKRRNKVL